MWKYHNYNFLLNSETHSWHKLENAGKEYGDDISTS